MIVLSPLAQAEGDVLRQIPRLEWPDGFGQAKCPPFEVWISRYFLVQLFDEGGPAIRMSVNRTALDSISGRWVEGISWDELQECKRQSGRGDQWAVELYPADASVVDVANMRHLWLLTTPPPFGWNRGAS